jgi:hypothetical protein
MFSTILVVLLFAVLGAAIALYGYRLLLVFLPVWGFIGGFVLSATTHAAFFGESFLSTTFAILLAVGVGLLGAVLSYFFYAFGIGIVAFAIGASLVSGFLGLFNLGDGLLGVILILLAGVAMVVVTFAFKLQKYVIEALTAVLGANFLVYALALLFNAVDLQATLKVGNTVKLLIEHSWLWLLPWLAAAVGGFLFQNRFNKNWEFSKNNLKENWG